VSKFLSVLLVAVSLLHHTIVMGGNGVLYHSMEGVGHAVLHWQETAHHHHGDGSVHEEPTDDSTRHMQVDGVLGAIALPVPALPVAFTLPVSSPVPAPAETRPAPFLAAPPRPPRPAA
jgi:hypothetical protein